MTIPQSCGCEAPEGGQVRYGVFLRPSAALIAETLRSFAVTHEVYGFRAANAYPPHITLVGSIASSVSQDVLIDAVSEALRGHTSVRLFSEGMSLVQGSVMYRFSDAEPVAPRQKDSGVPVPGSGVRELMGSILEAVSGLRHFHDEDFTAARRRLDSPERFSPHLSIISFDGVDSPELSAEALELLQQLGLGHSIVDTFEWVHLLRLHAQDWSASYWDSLSWSVVKTWRLEDAHE